MSRSQLPRLVAVALVLMPELAACGGGNPVAKAPGAGTSPTEPPAGGACAATPPSGYEGFCFDSHLRVYVMHVPTAAPAGKLPLIVSLHGAAGSAAVGQPINIPAALDSGFAVVTPEGTFRSGTFGGTVRTGNIWSAGGPWDTWTGGADDVHFIGALIDTIAASHAIDRARVFVVGFSNGSTLAYRLAHELSASIAAVGALSGPELEGWGYPEPTDTVAVIHVHGVADTTIPILGGIRDGVAYTSAATTTERWRRRNGAGPQPDTLLNAQGVLSLRWRTRSGRGDVVLCTHPGGHGLGPGVGPEVFLNFFKSLPARIR